VPFVGSKAEKYGTVLTFAGIAALLFILTMTLLGYLS
jgi:hypothetical protein